MKNALELLQTILSIHSIHGDALKSFQTIPSIHFHPWRCAEIVPDDSQHTLPSMEIKNE
jgi:hypothetical protein